MTDFINSMTSIFNIEYTFFNIVSIYVINKLICNVFKIVELNRGIKQVITVILSILNGIIFHFIFNEDAENILCSAMLSIIAYDYIIRIILKKLKIK